MKSAANCQDSRVSEMSPIFSRDAFSRLDPSDDASFYAKDRFVSHLDKVALSTVEHLIGSLIVEDQPAILDLMAGWDSHIPEALTPSEVVGLGLNENELKENAGLTGYVLHDINRDPRLPFSDNRFDAVINTVSVDYMTQPVAVFKEVVRILRPGGLFLVIFSDRMFPQKAVRLWRESTQDERAILVDEFFKQCDGFEKSSLFVSRGKPRPGDDKYAGSTPVSDPVYALYAEKKGGRPDRKPRRVGPVGYGEKPDADALEQKKAAIKETLCCPHCGGKLNRWAVPDNPFCQTWDNEFMYICFNDECPYFVRGWDKMYQDTQQGMSYRLMYNPEKDRCLPIPVRSHQDHRDGIRG
jgi:SAM-dependent methyltransferase